MNDYMSYIHENVEKNVYENDHLSMMLILFVKMIVRMRLLKILVHLVIWFRMIMLMWKVSQQSGML